MYPVAVWQRTACLIRKLIHTNWEKQNNNTNAIEKNPFNYYISKNRGHGSDLKFLSGPLLVLIHLKFSAFSKCTAFSDLFKVRIPDQGPQLGCYSRCCAISGNFWCKKRKHQWGTWEIGHYGKGPMSSYYHFYYSTFEHVKLRSISFGSKKNINNIMCFS